MEPLTSYFQSEFNTQRDQWENALLKELKLTEVGNKATKKLLAGFSWPTLSLERTQEVSLTPASSWKKAAVTYNVLPKNIKASLHDDLKAGVKNFFFEKSALSKDSWKVIEETLAGTSDLEVFIPHGKEFSSSSFTVVTDIISGKDVHDQGGNIPQELAALATKLVNDKTTGNLYLGVYVDSLFFQNIAKLRAARLLAEKICQEKNTERKIFIVALTSYQGWSLYERYSNMLRSVAALSSAYIGCADYAQSSGYNSLLELEAENLKEDEHSERSRRMARNTSHVLSLESMLGVVSDASYGSYHLESLTTKFCEDSWSLMQRILKGEDLTGEISAVRDQRLQNMKTRKTIMSGINDYPDAKETLGVTLKAPTFFRQARAFEELRLKMETIKKPSVYVAVFGDHAALNARLNFARNYFELLGLNVVDSGHGEPDLTRRDDIFVLVAADEAYESLKNISVSAKQKFVAGKVELPGYKNIFAGQNVFEVLASLLGGKV